MSNQELSIFKLKELIHYDSDTGKITWIKPRRGCVTGSLAGSNHNKGYLRISILYKNYLCHRIAWFYHYEEWPSLEIDHINGDKKDNRIENLRLLTHSENLQNKIWQSNSSAGVKGVSWDKVRKKWDAQISLGGRVVYRQRFNELNEAAEAIELKRREIHPMCRENSTPPGMAAAVFGPMLKEVAS